VKSRACLSLLLCSLTALVAATSAAEEGAERRLWWRPSLLLQAVADDNALLVDGGNAGELGFWVTPRVELGYRAPSYQLGADLAVDVRQQTRQLVSDETFYRLNGTGEIGLLPGLSLRLSDAYVPQPVRLGLPDDQPSNLLQTNRAQGELRYWRALSEGREVSIGISGARFDTESFAAVIPGPGGAPMLDPDFRADFWEGGGFAELQSPLTRHSALYVDGRARYRSFDESPQSDLGEYSLLVGLRTIRLGGFALDIGGGGGVLDFRGGSTTPRFLGRVQLGYRHRSGWRLALAAHHRFTADLAGNDFVDTTGRISLERYFGPRTATSLTVFTSYLQDESQVRSSNLFGGLELALRRQIARNLQIGLSYRYWDNGGSFSVDDFQQNRVMMTLGYRR